MDAIAWRVYQYYTLDALNSPEYKVFCSIPIHDRLQNIITLPTLGYNHIQNEFIREHLIEYCKRFKNDFIIAAQHREGCFPDYMLMLIIPKAKKMMLADHLNCEEQDVETLINEGAFKGPTCWVTEFLSSVQALTMSSNR